MTACKLPSEVNCSLSIPGALEPDYESKEYFENPDIDTNNPGNLNYDDQREEERYSLRKAQPYKCVTALGGNNS